MMLFGQFVGDWECDVVLIQREGSKVNGSCEWHFRLGSSGQGDLPICRAVNVCVTFCLALIHRICQTNSPKLSACPSFFSRQGWRLRRAPAGQEPTAPAALYCESDCK